MIFSQNDQINWMPYPIKPEWLSIFRLIVPARPGIYGIPTGKVFITSNYQPVLVSTGGKEGWTTLALDGGGFPIVIATAFNTIEAVPENLIQNYIKVFGSEVVLFVPLSLADAWGWQDGEMRLGIKVQVVSDDFPERDQVAPKKTAWLIRFYAGLHLALAQVLLMIIPIIMVNPYALVPIAVVVLLNSMLIAILWNKIPGNRLNTGFLVGIPSAGLIVLLISRGLLDIHMLFSFGVLLFNIWITFVFSGARSFE